ncbi:alpha/beta hydrolase, putative [Paecilomyces variotii No. 5]|uniref:Alpha/beta hydrolase, putative n=1 Tax=Byssochlamys spectabilis (strain No. 5 / NBRC 109023) TaxID=1356009 RepID=V5FJ04_BYSSN|nr:alpha/beta hydrolase, putative [Paecilomyces variotii No. 5]
MPYLFIKDHKLNYADSHPEGAPSGGLTFICIHGLGSSQNYYFPVIPYLTDKHRCITFDTYGSGRSSYTGLEQSVESIAEDVISIMDELRISNAVCVGHSMGGMVVSHLAAAHPDKVLAVVAIGPVHPKSSTADIFSKRIRMVTESGMEGVADSIPSQATGSRASHLQKAFIRELILNQTPLGYASICRAIANAHPPNYAGVKVPFLLIAGQEDKSAPMDGCKYIFENISSKIKRMEVLPGVGHWHCIEASDDVGRLISEFTGTLQAGDFGLGADYL